MIEHLLLFARWAGDSMSRDPAAWIQAVGSIIALAIAIALPRSELRRRRETARRTSLALAAQAVAAIRHQCLGVRAVDPDEDEEPEVLNERTVSLDLEVIDDALSKINIDDISSAVAGVEVVRLRGTLRTCRMTMDDYRRDLQSLTRLTSGDVERRLMRDSLKVAEDALLSLKQTFHREWNEQRSRQRTRFRISFKQRIVAALRRMRRR